MPVKQWDTASEWLAEWILDENCEVTDDGYLRLKEGRTQGTARVIVDGGESWRSWSTFTIAGTRPEGSNVIIYYRTADSLEGLQTKNFVVLTDGALSDGEDVLNIGADMKRQGIQPGRFLEIKLELISS